MHPKGTEVEYVTDIIISADDAKKLEGLDVKVIQNSIINGKEYENVFEVNRKLPRPTQNYDRKYMTEFTTEERQPSHQSRYIQNAPTNVYHTKAGDEVTVTTTFEKTNCPESQQNQRLYQSNANNYNTIASGWNNEFDTQPLKHVSRIEPVSDINLQFSRPNNAQRSETEFFHEVKISHDNANLHNSRPSQFYDNSNINYNNNNNNNMINRNDQRNATYNDYVAYKYNKCLEGHKNMNQSNFVDDEFSTNNGMSRSRSIPVTYIRNDQNANRDWEDRDQMARNNYKNHYLRQEILTETIRDRGLNRSTHGLSNVNGMSKVHDCDSYVQPNLRFTNNCSDFLQANPNTVQPSVGLYDMHDQAQGNPSFVTKTKKILETTRVVTTKKKSNWFNTHM